MDTQTLRQRSNDETTATATATATPTSTDDKKTIREKKLMKARRGIRSLAVAVALPLILSILSYFLSPPPALHPKENETSRGWYPPAWTMNVAEATTASLMGLAAWLVWADGGMKSPTPVALFAAQLILGLAWASFANAGRVAFLLSLAKVAVLAGCARCFQRVNPFAGNLVKACTAWAAILAFLSYKMM